MNHNPSVPKPSSELQANDTVKIESAAQARAVVSALAWIIAKNIEEAKKREELLLHAESATIDNDHVGQHAQEPRRRGSRLAVKLRRRIIFDKLVGGVQSCTSRFTREKKK